MSRTGVECRVFIDGAWLDDGNAAAPWIETRRNRFGQPHPVSAAIWSPNRFAQTFHDDPANGRYTRGVVNVAGVAYWGMVATAARVPVTPGETVTVSAEMRGGSGATTAHIRIFWHDAAGASIAGTEVNGPAKTVGASWQVVATTGTAPANAATAGWYFMLASSSPVGSVFESRRGMIEAAPTAGAFFDGDMPDTTLVRYGWTAAPNASASKMETREYAGYEPPGPAVPKGVSAIDGLSVTWGRETTVEQPRSASCAFRVVDDPGGTGLLDAIALGQRVDVIADATISGDAAPVMSAFYDPGFAAEVRATAKNATVTRSQDRAADADTWSAKVTIANASTAAAVTFPPGVIQPPGTNPAAWTDLQATNPGETWHLAVAVHAPQGVTVTVRPVYYSGPYADAATIAPESAVVVGSGAFQTAAVTFHPGATNLWVGFHIDTIGGATWATIGGATWATIDPNLTWADLKTVYVDAVAMNAPGPGVSTSVQVFSGRITDLEAEYDEEWDAHVVAVTASDFMADLGNRYVGSAPWPTEPTSARVARILAEAAVEGEPAVAIDIAATFADIPMSWDDVDHSAAAGLIVDVAQSVDAVLWSASHPATGPYLKLEDPAHRVPLFEFDYNGNIVVVPIEFADPDTAPPAISACDVLRDPVAYVISVADIATRIDLTWLGQPVDPNAPDAATTEEHFRIVATPRERQYGTRAVSVQTLLTTSADASRVADQLLGRLNATWRIEGLVYSDADVTVPDANAARTILTLLNGVTRGGQAILLTDLNPASPVGESAPVYLEGGGYDFTGGGWSLSLIVSRGGGFGHSAAWDEMPNDAAWSWDAFDPALSWDDVRGVAAPDAEE